MTDTKDTSVLVVDDEPELADLFRAYLIPKYDVHIATGGPEALKIIDDTIDVVLLDRRMPEMSGNDVLDAIRREGYDTRVAMLTAVEPDDEIVDMPLDDYKKKPITKEELRTLVEVLIQRATYDRQSQEFFALASKKATLEAAKTTNTEAYETLTERMNELKSDLTNTLDHLAAKDAFAEIGDD
ncbi:DNA-binding protein [Halorubrum ezzemoulense]|nr:DNA-binding protein [Halorubrum ezzemoulense]